MINVNKKSGFIALFSVIIVSFILLLMAVTLNFSGFSGRYNILDGESKERANNLAYACIEKSRLIIAINNSYTGESDYDVGTEECHYKIESGGVLKARAESGDAHTFYRANVNVSETDIPITCFKELKTQSELNGSTCP